MCLYNTIFLPNLVRRLAFAALPDYNAGMITSGKNELAGKKVYEIAYALWRIAANSSEKVFADILRDKALEMVSFAADTNYLDLNRTTDTLQVIIKFAVDVNCISISNAAILAREIGNLNAAIPENDFADINIADMFSSQNGPAENNGAKEEITANDPSNAVSGKKAEERQSAILERIRQIGDCRLSDIQAILPDSSERTIRYDLESLVQQNLIERLGTGGRSVYYRAKQ
jgi:hypothetical protein